MHMEAQEGDIGDAPGTWALAPSSRGFFGHPNAAFSHRPSLDSLQPPFRLGNFILACPSSDHTSATAISVKPLSLISYVV